MKIVFSEFKNYFIEQLMEDDTALIGDDTEFKKLTSWDSLTAMSVIAMVEEKYSIILKESDLRDCRTIIDIYEMISDKIHS